MTRALITELDTGKTHRAEFTAADADALYGASRQGLEIAMGRPVYLGDTLHSADLLPFPNTDMMLGSITQQLAEARRVIQWAGLGEPVSLAALCTAQEVLETHGDPACAGDRNLLTIADTAVLTARQAERPDTSLWATMKRHGLLEVFAGGMALLAFCWAVFAIVLH